MALASSTQLNKSYQMRSLSVTSRLNPMDQSIEKELKELKIKESSSKSASERITIGLHGLAELYGCINQALSLPMTQQALSLGQHNRDVGKLLKGCSSLLNICNAIMDIVVQQLVITKELESSISEKKENYKFGSSIESYNSSREELIRKARQVLFTLNQLNADLIGDENDQKSALLKSLKCVNIINSSVYESLLFFLSMPVSKPKRSFISMLVNKSKSETGNEINDVENILYESVSGKEIKDDKLSFYVGKVKTLVDVIMGFEKGLEEMSKLLFETKAFLMNIVSF